MVDQRVLKTIIAEAGGDPAAMAAVAAVINNRAQQTGKTPLQVVQQRNQFEGYSNPGPAISKQLNDAKLLARAEQAYSGVASGAIPDPTNGGTQFRAASASGGLHAPHGTVNIGGNVFARGNSAPQTALSAINAVAPTPQSRPTSALGYEPSQPSVRAISVSPNGSPILPQMKLPQDAMYGINRLDPNHVTHAPADFTTQDVGVPDARLSQLSAPFPQPANAFAGSRVNGSAFPRVGGDQSIGGPDQLIPPAPRVFVPSIFGDRSQISQKDFSQPELAILERAAQHAESVGRSNITPFDYETPLFPYKGDPLNNTDLVNSMQKTIGGAQFTRDANGDLVITDKYDFRDIGINGPLDGYGIAHAIGSTLLPEGKGRDVNIRITPKAQSSEPAMPRGALGQQMKSAAPVVSANAFSGSRGSVGATGGGLVSHPVQTLRIDPLTNQVISGNQPQSLQDALNVYAQRQALNTNGGSVKTTSAQAGNVALPKGVVPKQAAADLAAITKPNAFSGAVASIGAQPPKVASTGFATFTPNGMKPTLPSSTVNAASPLDNRYLGLTSTPPVPASVSAIAAATQPFAGSAAAIRARAPLPRAPSSAAIPLTSFNTVNPVSQILPRVQSTFNSSPIGHVTSLLTGQPIQGGLLGMLFNQGGLFNTSAPRATQATSVPVPVVGYSGNANVYSNELAGANQGFGGENAVMPDSMNNKRWLTGY